MAGKRVLVFGSGHLASRVASLAAARGFEPEHMPGSQPFGAPASESRYAVIRRALAGVKVETLSAAVLVDDEDDRNLEMAIALMSLDTRLPIVASMFNENVSP